MLIFYNQLHNKIIETDEQAKDVLGNDVIKYYVLY